VSYVIPATCRDCGGDETGWWVGRYKDHHGQHANRCKECYLAVVRAHQKKRGHGRSHRGPNFIEGKLYGPPRPKPSRITMIVCVDCGVDVRKMSGAHVRCRACTNKNIGAHQQMRRDIIATGDKSITWRALGKRDRWCCHLCGDPVPPIPGAARSLGGSRYGATIDHIVPLIAGGRHEWSNVALAHRHCNISRGGKSVDEVKRHGNRRHRSNW